MSKDKSERTPRSKGGMFYLAGKTPRSEGGVFYLQVRVADVEKTAFVEASRLAGLNMSAWVRERLRKAAREELLSFGKTVPFLNGK